MKSEPVNRRTCNVIVERKGTIELNNDLQNTTQKTKDCATRTPQNIGGKLRCLGRVSMSCTTRDTHRGTVKRHDMEIVFDTCVYINENNYINATGAGTAYPSGVPERGSCYSIFSFMCMFCRSLFVLLYFFVCPMCCLFFFDIRITPLVSSSI